MIRILNEAEKSLARALWKEIFPEDTDNFLDAYEEIKKDQMLLGDLEEGSLLSMVHFNPFQAHVGDAKLQTIHYIVAVATRPECRHEGRMKALLHEGMSELLRQGEPFTFLMPVSEDIYTPFDFVTVYEQVKHTLSASLFSELKEAAPCDILELCQVSERILSRKADVYCERNEAYFRDLRKELASEDGKILLLKKDDRISGYLAAFPGNPGVVREAVEEDCQLPVFIDHPSKIMFRLLNVESFLRPVASRKERTVLLYLKDNFLTENEGWYFWAIHRDGSLLKRLSTEEAEVVHRIITHKLHLSTEYPPYFVDNLENSQDILNISLAGLGIESGKTSTKVDILWITDAAGLVRWRFGEGEVPELSDVRRAERIFLNETV